MVKVCTMVEGEPESGVVLIGSWIFLGFAHVGCLLRTKMHIGFLLQCKQSGMMASVFRNLRTKAKCGYMSTTSEHVRMVRNVFRNVRTKAECGGYMGTTTKRVRNVFQE